METCFRSFLCEYICPSLKDVLKFLEENEHLEVGVLIMEYEKKQIPVEENLSVDRILGTADEIFYDEYHFEEFNPYTDVSIDAADELALLLKNWAEKHVDTQNFWIPGALIRTFEVTEEHIKMVRSE